MGQIGKNKLIIFTRYPEPGKTKTRLIPKLGAKKAALLQIRMLKHVLQKLSSLSKTQKIRIEIYFEGGSALQMSGIYGKEFYYKPQEGTDLGERMSLSLQRSFESNFDRTVIIGSDSPEIRPDHISEAFDSLESSDIVLGPAHDGGYYLIGAKKPHPWIFRGISWGSNTVLTETLKKSESENLKVHLLGTLKDIDRPNDLEGMELNLTDKISVIIPAINEESSIERSIELARSGQNIELIVADGGSRDKTVEISQRLGAKIVKTMKNRSIQMNEGAKASCGEILLFLHADTMLPKDYDKMIRETLDDSSVAAGAFSFKVDSNDLFLKFIEKTANWRSNYLEMPYGDQGIFMRRGIFNEQGGFPEILLMEDFEMMRALKKHGRIITLPDNALSSARRWEQKGIIRTTLKNQSIILAYLAGIEASTLARWYGRKN